MIDTRNRWPAEAAALLVPILIVCGPFLFTPRTLTGREVQASFGSRAAYAQQMAAQDGEWPRWNGRQHAGTPFLGDLHGSLHYPPNLLFLAIPPERAVGFLFAFHMLVAAVGMYRFSRYFEFRRSASTLGAKAPEPLESLSPRERQVLVALVRGQSLVDIAAALQVAPNTVSTYKTRLMDKLDQASLSDLVRYAVRHGIVD